MACRKLELQAFGITRSNSGSPSTSAASAWLFSSSIVLQQLTTGAHPSNIITPGLDPFICTLSYIRAHVLVELSPYFIASLCMSQALTSLIDRWWEARTVWGGVLNIARNIVREAASTWGFPPKEKVLLEMLGRWVIAMPYLLKAHIRKVSAREELDSLLPAKELDSLLASTDPCQRCAQVTTTED